MCRQYRNNRYVGGPGVNTTARCDYTFRSIFYCQTVSADYDEWQMCRDEDITQFAPSHGNTLMALANTFNGDWYIPKQHPNSTHNTTESVLYAANHNPENFQKPPGFFKLLSGLF